MEYGIKRFAFTIRGLGFTIHALCIGPSCGTEYTIELKYCNRCGANLSGGLEEQSPTAPISVTKPALAIGAIMTILTVLGLGCCSQARLNSRITRGSIRIRLRRLSS